METTEKAWRPVRFLLLITLFTSIRTYGGVLFEPHATIHASGDAKLLGESYGFSSVQGGAGVGYQDSWKFFKAEANGGYRNIKSETSGNTEGFLAQNYVVGLGLRFGEAMRLFGGLIPSTSMKSTADESTYSGEGVKGELSFFIYNNLHLFFEYKSETYDQHKRADGITTKLEGDLALKITSFSVGISMPFDFWQRQIR